ncbi:3,4-dihydroxybenzoate decarboxylase [Couchioplanes caeruleus subsp. azureus]|nr:3,4-dihydroxybenzoate decarboxylase [Couchioplanes caeruleus subsp. azureus]
MSVRAALADLRRRTPGRVHRHTAVDLDGVAAHFATRYAGIPATPWSRPEDVALYDAAPDSPFPVLLGLYGDAARVAGWLPGLPGRVTVDTVREMLTSVREPHLRRRGAACQQRDHGTALQELPALRTTGRDAGPFVTMGLVLATDPATGATAMSTHRMLILGPDRLTIWMVPGRELRALHESALRRGERLPVSINIGAPPAAVIASAVASRFLPAGISKLGLAGALAGVPITLAPARTQPTPVLAETEIVIEGYLDDTTADERPDGGTSLPEFLGYDGTAHRSVPVVTVTGMTSRRSSVYEAVIGPGREQSVILGMAGELSVILSGIDHADWALIADLHFAPAGGGMLLLVMSVRKPTPAAERRLGRLAWRIFEMHPFLKTIVMVDEDVDISAPEDVLWAMTTRANLAADARSFAGFRPLPMDPSQSDAWAGERGGRDRRTVVDATVPLPLRATVTRSFPVALPTWRR